MNRDELISAWKAEEKIAHIHGRDFSHIDGRYTEQVNLADCCSTAVCTGAHTHFLSER